MKLLIVYGTTDGQTGEIAERLGKAVREDGHQVQVVNASRLPRRLDPGQFDGVLVGGSVHYQRYQLSVSRFIRRHRDALQRTCSGFFSVCLAIGSKDAAFRRSARELMLRFLEKRGWTPDLTEVFAGALRFSRYGFLRRSMMQVIAREEIGNVDPSRDYVFTDWEQVDRFAATFARYAAAKSLARRAAPGVPGQSLGPASPH